MIRIDRIALSGLENTEALIDLAHKAKVFLNYQKWCGKVLDGWLYKGWSDVLGVFYFRLEPAMPDVPDFVWIIQGDAPPPAYIDAEDNPNGACALDAYVREVQKWINAVNDGRPVDDLMPVFYAPDKAMAEIVQNRMDMIRKEMLSGLGDELTECPEGLADEGQA